MVTQLQDQIEKSKLTSPLIIELNKNPKKYIDHSSSFRNLISKYENSFRDDFMDTVYSKHNKEMRKFMEESSGLIGDLDTCYSDAVTLDMYLRKLDRRIDDARNLPLAARKYVEHHRTHCTDINAYVNQMDERMGHQLDGSLE